MTVRKVSYRKFSQSLRSFEMTVFHGRKVRLSQKSVMANLIRHPLKTDY